MKLAFNESQKGKLELIRELNIQRESLAEALKENTVLNEEVRIKAEFIKLMKEQTDEQNINDQQGNQDSGVENDKESVNDPEVIIYQEVRKDTPTIEKNDISKEPTPSRKPGDKEKCKECDFQPNVPTHLKGHNVKHAGQYQCQRGCKAAFKTLGALDEHTRNQHDKPKVLEYQCENCDSIFSALFHLRIHKAKKHAENAQKNSPSINCDFCGQVFQTYEHLNMHKEKCDEGFTNSEEVGECYYYRRGKCLKGNTCKFIHKELKDSTPFCRNGIQCRYLASGVCSFFHAGIGVQNPKHKESFQEPIMNERRTFCRFLEDCNRVPNCPFIHSELDFPKLPNRNGPPLGARRIAEAWMEY